MNLPDTIVYRYAQVRMRLRGSFLACVRWLFIDGWLAQANFWFFTAKACLARVRWARGRFRACLRRRVCHLHVRWRSHLRRRAVARE